MSEYATEWTGCWPCLCHGEWKLYKDGDILDVDIPFQESPAYTFGEYYERRFVDWMEEFDSYEDGIPCEEWIKQYKDWLSSFAPEEDFEKIYCAFQENDWRHNSCGGCI